MIFMNTDSRIVRMEADEAGAEGNASLMMYEPGRVMATVHIPGIPAAVAKATADAFNEAMDAERGQHADDMAREEVA